MWGEMRHGGGEKEERIEADMLVVARKSDGTFTSTGFLSRGHVRSLLLSFPSFGRSCAIALFVIELSVRHSVFFSSGNDDVLSR